MAAKTKLNRIERSLVDGLGELLADLKADGPIEGNLTRRRIVLDLAPRPGALAPAARRGGKNSTCRLVRLLAVRRSKRRL